MSWVFYIFYPRSRSNAIINRRERPRRYQRQTRYDQHSRLLQSRDLESFELDHLITHCGLDYRPNSRDVNRHRGDLSTRPGCSFGRFTLQSRRIVIWYRPDLRGTRKASSLFIPKGALDPINMAAACLQGKDIRRIDQFVERGWKSIPRSRFQRATTSCLVSHWKDMGINSVEDKSSRN